MNNKVLKINILKKTLKALYKAEKVDMYRIERFKKLLKEVNV